MNRGNEFPLKPSRKGGKEVRDTMYGVMESDEPSAEWLELLNLEKWEL